jgi:hypothetical protein
MVFKHTVIAACIIFCFGHSNITLAQDSIKPYPEFPAQIRKDRISAVVISEAVLLTGSMAGLYSIWYKDKTNSSFHFFNDNAEWNQMDKSGHVAGAYHIARLTHLSARWAGMSNKNAVLYGSILSTAFMSCIEVFDGLSPEYGASAGDLVADAGGILIFAGQELLWNEQRISIRYSWHPSIYSKYRPELLGSNPMEQIVKDYNGITIWASINPKSFIKESSLPSWLNIAVGYGVEGMTGAFNNPSYNDKGQYIPNFQRRQQVYLSLDIDLKRLNVRSKTLKYFLHAVDFIKIPMPTLEYDAKEGLRFWPVYF